MDTTPQKKQTRAGGKTRKKKAEKKQNKKTEKKNRWTGSNGNGILKVCFLRRNKNYNLEFDRAWVRSFFDGATFHKVLKDTPQYALSSNLRQEWGVSFKTFQNVAPS